MGTVVKALVNFAYSNDPDPDRGRYERTETRFVHAAVGAYCPYDQNKIASVMVNPAPGSNEPTHRVVAYTHNAVNSGSDRREPPPARDMINLPTAWQEPTGTGAVRLPHLMDGVFVAGRRGDERSDCDAQGTVLASLVGAIPGEVTPPNPPQIPAPPPPTAQTLTPPRPIAAPPPPKQPPRPPQPLPPPPQEQPRLHQNSRRLHRNRWSLLLLVRSRGVLPAVAAVVAPAAMAVAATAAATVAVADVAHAAGLVRLAPRLEPSRRPPPKPPLILRDDRMTRFRPRGQPPPLARRCRAGPVHYVNTQGFPITYAHSVEFTQVCLYKLD